MKRNNAKKIQYTSEIQDAVNDFSDFKYISVSLKTLILIKRNLYFLVLDSVISSNKWSDKYKIILISNTYLKQNVEWSKRFVQYFEIWFEWLHVKYYLQKINSKRIVQIFTIFSGIFIACWAIFYHANQIDVMHNLVLSQHWNYLLNNDKFIL